MKRITELARSINVWLARSADDAASPLQWQLDHPLQLQSLEDRVLYSVVPLPVDTLDVPADTPDANDVEFSEIQSNSSFLFAEPPSSDVSTILDDQQQSNFITDGSLRTPELVLENLDQLTNAVEDSLSDHGESDNAIQETPITAAGLVEVPPDQSSSGFITLNEGQSFLINDDFLGSLTATYATGFRLTEAPSSGTILVQGEALQAGDFVDGISILNDEIVFIPEISFTGNDSFSIESDDTTLNLFSNDFSILYQAVADDGVVVVGDTFAPVTDAAVTFTTDAADSQPRIESLADGGYVIATILSEDNGGIVFQQFDSEGVESGSEVVVDSVHSQLSDLEIVSVEDGGFLVAFRGRENGSEQINIHRYDGNGQPVAFFDGSTQLSPALGSATDEIALLNLEEDRFLVTYVQSISNEVNSIIYNLDGTVENTITIENSNALPDPTTPHTTLLADGSFVVAWVRTETDGVTKSIEAATFDPGGHFISQSIFLAASDSTNDFALASAPDGSFAVLWQGTPNNSDAIYAVRYDRYGNQITAPSLVTLDSPAALAGADIIALDDGSFVVSYTSINAEGVQEIFGQRLDQNLNTFGSPFTIATEGIGLPNDADLTLLNDGTLVASFQSQNPGSTTSVSHQQLEMAVTSDGVNATDLMSIIGIDDTSSSEGIFSLNLSGLPAGTQISTGNTDADGNLIFNEVADAAAPMILDSVSLTGLSIIPPVGATEDLVGTILLTTNDGSKNSDTVANFRVVIDPTIDVAGTNNAPQQQFDEADVIRRGDSQTVDLAGFLVDPDQAQSPTLSSPTEISLAAPINGVSLIEDAGNYRLDIDLQQFQGVIETVIALNAVDVNTGEIFSYDLQLNFVDDIIISGTVAHDVDIDGSIDGDAGFDNAEVLLFTGTLENGAFTEEDLISITYTDDQGRFEFSELMADEEYFVVVNSLFVLNDQSDLRSVWAQQTFSSQGGVFKGDSGFELTQQDGFLIGGRDSERSDGVNESDLLIDSQHVISVSTANNVLVSDEVNFGFNFNIVNVVDNSNQLVTSDADQLNGQGTLTQFINNANRIAGENRLIFVPTTDANSTNENGERWWTIEVSDLLPEIRDDFTIIDGNAYQVSADGLIRNDLNPGFVEGTFAGQRVGIAGDRIGVDDLFLSEISAPDLEITRATFDSNGIPVASLEYGLKVRGDSANRDVESVEISNIAIHGFGLDDSFSGQQRNQSANILIDGTDVNGVSFNVTDFVISGNVIGARPDFSTGVNPSNNITVLSAGPALNDQGENVLADNANAIRGNLIVNADYRGIYLINNDDQDSSRTGNLVIADNQITSNGRPGETRGDGIEIGFASQSLTIVGNHISDNNAFGVDLFRSFGEVDLLQNTIDNNRSQVGNTTDEGGGVRLFGILNEVFGNEITNNGGPGVHVPGQFNVNDQSRLIPSAINTIHSNDFANNDTIPIDLSRPLNAGGNPNNFEDYDFQIANFGDGIDANNGDDVVFDTFTGNFSVDAPEILEASYDGTVLSILFSDELSFRADPSEIIQIYLVQEGSGLNDSFSFLAEGGVLDLLIEDGNFRLNLTPDPSFLEADLTQPISIAATGSFYRDPAFTIRPGETFVFRGINTTEFSSSQSVDVNRAPVFSNDQTTFARPEGNTFVADLAATDADGDTITYAVDGLGDGALLEINSEGELSFIAPPDFENPTDLNGDNQYDVVVIATDNRGMSTSIDVSVSVTNVNEIPIITQADAFTIDEGDTAVGTVTATDADGDTIVFSIVPGSADGHLFQLTPQGILSFIAPPDFENPLSVSGTNNYTLTVAADDLNEGTSTRQISVDVIDVNEPPILNVANNYSIAENLSFVDIITATNVGGDDVLITISGGEDANLFDLDADGNLTFINAPDFENPSDANGDNLYKIELQAEDLNGLTVSRTVDILITPVNEQAFFIGQEPDLIIQQDESSNQSFDFINKFVDPDGDNLNLRIVGGSDAQLFEIVDNQLRLIDVPEILGASSPTFEVQVVASDGLIDSEAETISLRVNNINDRPLVTTADYSFRQDERDANAAFLIPAEDRFDADDDATSVTLLSNQGDNDLFEVIDDEIRFKTPPILIDGQPQTFQVVAAINDGQINSEPIQLTVTVDNVNDRPEITDVVPTKEIEQSDSVLETGFDLSSVSTFDADGDSVLLQIEGDGRDNHLFEIIDQRIAFKEVPQLFGGQQRTYEVTVAANDGLESSDPEPITIVVTNLNDAPVIESIIPSAALKTDLQNNNPIFTFAASDPDFDNVTFEIAGGRDATMFSVNDQGQLFIESSQQDTLDPIAAGDQLEVSVRATDGSLFSQTRSILVSVTGDANEVEGVSVIELQPVAPVTRDDDSAAPSESLEFDPPQSDDELTVIAPAKPVQLTSPDLPEPNQPKKFDFDARTIVSDLTVGDDDAFSALSADFITYLSTPDSQGPQLITQEIEDIADLRRRHDGGELEESLLAKYFWKGFDDSENEYMRRNLQVDTTTIVAASAGISLGLASYVRIAAMATTVVTQIPTWKALDISPLITAFDEDEAETIHQIVDN